MHEYSIIQAMFDQIEAIASERQARSVTHVYIRVGCAAGVDVPLLKTAYETFRLSTLCEHAPLDVEEVPERWGCPSGHGDILKGARLECQACGRPARLVSGDEIVLERLELEVL